MKSDIKILQFLLDKKQDKFTIKKIADTLQINYRIAYEQVIRLEKESLIKITKTGNSKICEFEYAFDPRIFEAEYERRKNFSKTRIF